MTAPQIGKPRDDRAIILPVKCPVFVQCNGPRWDCAGACAFEALCMDRVKHPEKYKGVER